MRLTGVRPNLHAPKDHPTADALESLSNVVTTRKEEKERLNSPSEAIANGQVSRGLVPSHPMRLCHPPDGSTSPNYKLLCFITTKFFFAKRRTH
jgi:hypothetical protein